MSARTLRRAAALAGALVLCVGAQARQARAHALAPSLLVLEETTAGRVDLEAARLRLELAGVSLATVADGIGGCGENLLLNFALTGVDGCYGFGERTRRLNKLGDSADFLTVDVVAVFRHTYARDDYDPSYVAIPLAILKIGEQELGRIIFKLNKDQTQRVGIKVT